LASPDAPVLVDSHAPDESQVGQSYNLRDRTTIQPPDKLGFLRASRKGSCLVLIIE